MNNPCIIINNIEKSRAYLLKIGVWLTKLWQRRELKICCN